MPTRASRQHRSVAARGTRDLQRNVEDVLDLDELVSDAMVRDKRVIVDLFRRCGKDVPPSTSREGGGAGGSSGGGAE